MQPTRAKFQKYTNSMYNSTINQPNQKMEKRPKTTLLQKIYIYGQKAQGKSSTYIIMTQIQIKTTTSCHLTAVGKTISLVKKTQKVYIQ